MRGASSCYVAFSTDREGGLASRNRNHSQSRLGSEKHFLNQTLAVRKLWRGLVVAIELEDTLELHKTKKSRKTRSSGATSTMDLDALQWLKGVNKQGKFDGGLIAK